MEDQHRLPEPVFPSASKEELARLFPSFTDVVKYIMEVKGVSRKQLIECSRLNKVIISRILTNKNDKGSSYTPSNRIVATICLTLKITKEDAQIVQYIVDLDYRMLDSFLDRGLGIDEANYELYEEGLPLLGSQDE